MTERLREIEQRCEKATPGCWLAIPDNTYVGVHVGIRHESTGLVSPIPRKDNAYADADFIANAREDIPYLLGVIKEQAEDNELLRDLVKELREPNGEHSEDAKPL